jgi:O-antigen/teichoic acid export membrane protein
MSSPDVPAQPLEPPGISLSQKAAHGVAWSFVQTVGIKVVSVIGNFVVAWLLVVKDFGYVGTAGGVAAFLSLPQGGLKELLITRGRDFPRYATSAFWLSMVLGLLSTVILIAGAPLAGRFFHEPRISGLIVVLACQNILTCASLVPDVRANIDLRFRFLSVIGMLNALGLTVLTVAFAALGFGAYSFVLPMPILAAGRMTALWVASPQPVGLTPQIHLWRDLFADNALLLGAAFFFMVTLQGDYLILGRMYDKKIVGEYYWGFIVSTQVLQLLASNVAGVLLPSLARLQDEPGRLRSAFLRASSVLTLVAIPGCVLQVTLADPFIKLVFKSEYYAAIPIVQILSAGWMIMAVHHSATMLLKAQSRFGVYLWLNAAAAVVFVACVYAGAKLGQGVGAAVGVMAYSVLVGPTAVYVAIRPLKGTWRQTANVFAAPVFAGTLASAAGLWAGSIVPHGPGRDPIHNILRFAAICVVVAAIYTPLVRWLAGDAWSEMISRGRQLAGAALRKAG